MSEFADATAVSPREADGTTYDADLHPDWAIGGKANGGYLLAILSRAACHAVGGAHPLAVSGHFMRAPDSAPAEVHVEVVRRGRRVSTVRSTLWQGGKPCLDSLISVGEIPSEPPEWAWEAPPAMPPPEECAPSGNPHMEIELFRQVELRVDPATAPFPDPTGTPTIRSWFRLAGGADPDVLALLVAVDSLPPTVFNLNKYGWAPTVELSVLLRGVPAPGWLQCETRTEALAGGWFDEGAVVWDSTGRLVAHSRQLALTNAGS